MKFYRTAVLLMSLSHIYSFQPRTCTLVLLTVGNGTHAKDDPVPLGSIASPPVVITTRHGGSYTQRHIKTWKLVKNTPKEHLFSQRSASHESAQSTAVPWYYFFFSLCDTWPFPCRGWTCSGHESGFFRKRGWVACNTWCLYQFPT